MLLGANGCGELLPGGHALPSAAGHSRTFLLPGTFQVSTMVATRRTSCQHCVLQAPQEAVAGRRHWQPWLRCSCRKAAQRQRTCSSGRCLPGCSRFLRLASLCVLCHTAGSSLVLRLAGPSHCLPHLSCHAGRAVAHCVARPNLRPPRLLRLQASPRCCGCWRGSSGLTLARCMVRGRGWRTEGLGWCRITRGCLGLQPTGALRCWAAPRSCPGALMPCRARPPHAWVACIHALRVGEA